jgi:DME family drug/metabolite transporter
MKQEWKGYLYVFIAGSLWGTLGIFIKLMEQYGSTPSMTSFIRVVFAAIMLAVITLVKDGIKGFKVSRKTMIACALLGMICQGLYNILYSMSVTKNGMGLASVLLYTAPVFTCICSFVIFKEKLTPRKIIALMINIAGCMLTVTGGDLNGVKVVVFGLIVGVGAGLCYGLQAIFGRLATDEGSPFAVAAYNFMFASLFIALVTQPWKTGLEIINIKVIGIGFLYALIPTTLGYIIYFNALQKIKDSSKVTVIASVELVLATVFGVILYKEGISAANITGMFLVLGSILLFK